MIKSKRVEDVERLDDKELFNRALADAEGRYDSRHVERIEIEYTSNQEISFRALEAIAELHRRGTWLFQEIVVDGPVTTSHAPSGNYIDYTGSRVVKIKMRKGN